MRAQDAGEHLPGSPTEVDQRPHVRPFVGGQHRGNFQAGHRPHVRLVTLVVLGCCGAVLPKRLAVDVLECGLNMAHTVLEHGDRLDVRDRQVVHAAHRIRVVAAQ
jgi:hypothetical protein